MADFPSSEWLERLAAAAEATSVDPDLRLTVEQRITGAAPTGWHVEFADGAVRVGAGPADHATITLTSSLEIASAINAGELSAQRAFLDGALRIGGDIAALISHRRALDEVVGLLASAI